MPLAAAWAYLASLKITRLEVSLLFNAKLCKISGECGKFCRQAVTAAKLHKSGGEFGKTTFIA